MSQFQQSAKIFGHTVHMHVCMYVHIHTIHTYVHTCVHTCANMYVRICTYINICTCADTHRHQTTLDMHRHTDKCAHTYVGYTVHVLLTLVHPEQRDCGCYQHLLTFQQHCIPHPKCNWEWDLNKGVTNGPVPRRTREYT